MARAGFGSRHVTRVPASHAEFERLALCHTRSLLRVSRRLTSDPASAEDLVQDCLLLAWKNFHQFRSGTNCRAWLFRILFNAFYARQRVPVLILPDQKSTVVPERERDMDILRALGALPIEQRSVLLLGVVEGFTCSEMSEIFSVPIGTVMSRLSRARQAMRARLTAPAQLTAEEV